MKKKIVVGMVVWCSMVISSDFPIVSLDETQRLKNTIAEVRQELLVAKTDWDIPRVEYLKNVLAILFKETLNVEKKAFGTLAD